MNTDYACMFCLLFGLCNCKKLFVKKDAVVEITCQLIATENDYVEWYFEQSTIISLGTDVNPKFSTKYSVINTRNLQIINFTDADQGRYSCIGINGQNIRQDVIVTLCNVPNEINSLSYVLEENSSKGMSHQTNALCTHDTVIKSSNTYYDNNCKYLLRATLKLHISPQCNLKNDRRKDKKASIWNYTCMTLNDDQCVTSNEKLLVNVEWISRKERAFTKKIAGQSQKQMVVYTGDCASLNIKTNSNCDDNVKIYLTNDMYKILYLKNFNKTTAETFLCHIYKADNLDEIITASELEHADIDFKQLTNAFGGIAAVLVVILVFAGAVIKTLTSKNNCQSRTNSLPRAVERNQFIEEDQHNEDMVPDSLDIIDSVNHHSVDLRDSSGGRNSRSKPTLSGNSSAYYQFNVSRNSNIEAINEQKTVSVNSTDSNCSETESDPAVNPYVNTNFMNTYEQLDKTATTDMQTYEDVSYDY